MKQSAGNPATQAKNQYNAENYDRLYPYVKKGKKERYQEAAKIVGCSLNAFIEAALDRRADEVLEQARVEDWISENVVVKMNDQDTQDYMKEKASPIIGVDEETIEALKQDGKPE